MLLGQDPSSIGSWSLAYKVQRVMKTKGGGGLRKSRREDMNPKFSRLGEGDYQLCTH